MGGETIWPNYSFRYFSGKDFKFILNKPQEFETLTELRPDVIVTILGGNSIVDFKTNGEVKEEMLEFYDRLNNALPQTIKLAVQVEPRYYAEDNPYHAPTPQTFQSRRQILNNFMNKQLKKKVC